MTEFTGGVCDLYSEGIVYCRDTCLRRVQVKIDQYGTENFDLRVTSEDGSEIFVPFVYPHDDDDHAVKYDGNERLFSASLPSGNFQLEFFQNTDINNLAWPRFAYKVWEGVPEFDGYVSSHNVTIVKPELGSGECDELFLNNEMEYGLDSWFHRNDGDNLSWGYLESRPGEGMNGSMAIAYVDRRYSWHGIGRNIDTRCFHQNLNTFYEVPAWFKLENDDEAFICDRFDSNYPNRCPRATLKNVCYLDDAKEEIDWDYDGDIAMPNDIDGFNFLHGVLKVDDKYNAIERGFMYIKSYDPTIDMILDSFHMEKMEGACTGDFIRNDDFSIGDSRFWKEYGIVSFNTIIVDGDKH